MKARISAKHLTVRYFSLVAIAIITIHYSVFENTADDLEQAFLENQFSWVHQLTESALTDQNPLTASAFSTLLAEIKHSNQAFIEAIYNDKQLLPEDIAGVSQLEYGRIHALGDAAGLKARFLQKQALTLSNGSRFDVFYVLNNQLYEMSEDQMILAHRGQILVSLLLLGISLVVVVYISERLTRPISDFAKGLSKQSTQRLDTELQLKGAYTQELDDMLQTFNAYQARIKDLLERERSFNRYASHELRSPLMVIRGVGTLLGESTDPQFIEKQRQRLIHACNDMSEFIEVLLSLTRQTSQLQFAELAIDTSLVEKIISSHEGLIADKPIVWQLQIETDSTVAMPEAAFAILLGNLVKNAFTYTDEGTVDIRIDCDRMCVSDTGVGIDSQEHKPKGIGLGLLLVRDICRQFDCDYSLVANTQGGTDAIITFPPQHR